MPSPIMPVRFSSWFAARPTAAQNAVNQQLISGCEELQERLDEFNNMGATHHKNESLLSGLKQTVESASLLTGVGSSLYLGSRVIAGGRIAAVVLAHPVVSACAGLGLLLYPTLKWWPKAAAAEPEAPVAPQGAKS